MINWQNCIEYSIKHKKEPPESFFYKLQALDISVQNQNILVLGSNNGKLACKLAQLGSDVTAIDASQDFIDESSLQAQKSNTQVNFQCMKAESLNLKPHSFDVIYAHQSLKHFDIHKVLTEAKRLLVPGGYFATSNMRWLPRLDIVAKKSEEIFLKFNPHWEHYDFNGEIYPMPQWAVQNLILKSMFFYDEDVEYNKESWVGRLKASSYLGGSLSKSKLIEFEGEMMSLLDQIGSDNIKIRYRLDAHIFQFK